MPGLRSWLLARWDRTRSVIRAPRVRISIQGDDEAYAAYRTFTARHPRVLVTERKRWGVALLAVPDTFDEYLAGHSRQLLRQKRRLAEKAGFRYASVAPQDHLEDILGINRSAPSRQGHPMSERYLDPELVGRMFVGRSTIPGIVDADGRLRAYLVGLDLGEVYVFSNILGHADDLERGVMYLLVSEVVRARIDARRTVGQPTWVMYDTFWGASAGLAYFKERVGFHPYTVDWRWAGVA